MNEFAIRIENLSKQYKIGRRISKENLTETLSADLQAFSQRMIGLLSPAQKNLEDKNSQRSVWALRNVSFDVMPGESIGIIGSNGAGKTTLLKIISQITTPTQGRAILNGRVGSLLEVGTGFHTELTGRENIYLNGAILGMGRREIDQKFDEIVDFSGVDKFLDTPVKFYSSGMRVRLAFSVAAHLEPDILLVDEVLAVGDMAFQKKSLNKMENVVKGGRTVLFVSHNMATIKALCQKAAYIEQGRLRYFGDVDQAIAAYLEQGEVQKHNHFIKKPDPTLPAQVISARLINTQGNQETRFGHDQRFYIETQFKVHTPSHRMFFGLDIVDSGLDVLLTSYDFELDEDRITNKAVDTYTYRVEIPAPLLLPGNYRINLYVKRFYRRRQVFVDQVQHVCPFEIYDNGSVMAKTGVAWQGQVTVPLNWEEVSPTRIEENQDSI